MVLEDATGIDFEALDLNPIDPPRRRLENQEAEDAFTKRLLLLGAKWWVSEDRYVLFQQVYPDPRWSGLEESIEEGVKPLTERERRRTVVGWPSSGGLWVSEFERCG